MLDLERHEPEKEEMPTPNSLSKTHFNICPI